MAKYKFKKVYFLVDDRKVFGAGFEFVNCYRKKDYAATVLKQKNDNTKKIWDGKDNVPVKSTLEGFYLVHESFFDEEK